MCGQFRTIRQQIRSGLVLFFCIDFRMTELRWAGTYDD